MSNPISISPQNKPDNLQLLNNTRYKLKHHTLLSLPLSLLQTQTQPSKHCKTHTLLSLSLSLYLFPSPKPECQLDLTDHLSWDIGTNQVQRLKQFRWRAAVVIFLNWFSPESSGRWGDDMVCYVWFLILLLILICIALNFQIPHPPFLNLFVYQVPKSTKASTLNIPICISS